MDFSIKRVDETSYFKMPTRAHDNDSGYDLYAVHNDIIEVGETKVIRMGFMCEMPNFNISGHERVVRISGSIRPRSSQSKKGILVHYGTIDNGYRGEICITITNLSKDTYYINQGDRIAQYVLECIITPPLKEINEIKNNDLRGDGGFGSTGI